MRSQGKIIEEIKSIMHENPEMMLGYGENTAMEVMLKAKFLEAAANVYNVHKE